MNSVQKIAKNLGFSGISQIISSLLGFLLLIYIARYLGEAGFGIYSFAQSFTSLFIIIADIGISQFIIRELARNKDKSKEYTSNISIIRLFSSIITFLLIVLIINLMNYPSETVYVVYLFGIYTILLSFAQMYTSIFQAFEKMEYVALILTLDKLLLFTFGLLVFFLGYGLIELAYIYVIVGIVDLSVSLILVGKKISRITIKINKSLWKAIIIASFPFAINTLFATLFFKIDTILLFYLKGDIVVGIYNAAYNPLLAISFILTTMVTATIYPLMSKYFISSKNSLKLSTNLSTKYIVIIGVPITIGCFILADQFIELFYAGQYLASIIAFQILALFIPIRLINGITGTFLTSINKQGFRTFSIALAAIFNLILNIILIPYYSYIGASIATVLSEIFLYIILIYYNNKAFENLKLYKHFKNPFIAAIIMGIILLSLKEISLIFLIPIAIIVYFITLILLRTFNSTDKYIFKQIVKRG